MTIAPWAFGIDRASLEETTVDLCHLVMTQVVIPGFPRTSISIVDQGAGRPFRPRPCITILISSPVNTVRTGPNVRYFGTEEQWTIQFTSSPDDTYTVNVLGVAYTVVAVGLSVTALRDAMLMEMGLTAHPDWSESTTGTDTITIDGANKGQLLLVNATPSSVVTNRVLLNFFARGFLPALLQVNINCWGLLTKESPSAVQSGPSIAENMRDAFSDPELTLQMRNCWFAPTNVRVIDGAEVINQQTNSSAICQVIMKATSRMDVQTASGTAITTTPVIS